ncbi:MAG TPA: site-specific integrase [Pedobacter sp.]|nr:site-specific integrase [Pedobacter sp.]
MRKNFCLLFFIKKPKHYTDGPVPIYLRITYEGRRAELATGHKCPSSKWNAKTGRAMGTAESVRIFNGNLNQLETKIDHIYDELLKGDEPITVESIKNAVLGKSVATAKTIVEIFKEHNRKVSLLIGKELASATLTRYNTTLKHLQGFLGERYGALDFQINKINYQFITDFEFYLRTTRKCANNSAVKYVKNFKTIIRLCLASGWLDRDPFINYRAKLKPVIRCFLSNDELDAIANKHFDLERLGIVRDVFLFSCYTGLAYADVQKLKQSEIVKGFDDNFWINTKRKKTETRTALPLLPVAYAIFKKYLDHPLNYNSGRVFPVASNQKMNAYLKEIAVVCGITKPLTYHIARHTFATTITLSNGVPIETVSKMLGHTNIKTTQHYAKILDTKIGMDMAMLKEKLLVSTLPKSAI